MKIYRYKQFINESLKDDFSSLLDNKYKDVKEELIEMIEKSIKSDDKEVFSKFIDSYVKSPDDSAIEGLINDADVYDFYLKYRNDIDEILNEIKYFDDTPSEENVYGVYEYTIKATKKAISEFIRLVKDEVSGSTQGSSTEENTTADENTETI
jgi:hypothetical protein